MAGNPSLASLRGGINPILSAELAGLVNDRERFLSSRVVPIRNGVAVGARESGTIITSGGLFGDASTPIHRAIGASNNLSPGDSLGTVEYSSKEYNLASRIDERKINGALIDALGFEVTSLFNRLAIGREKELNTLLTTTANWSTNSFTASTGWTDVAADPIADIDTMVSRVGKYGMDSLTFYFSKAGLDALRRNKGVRQYFPSDSNRNSVSTPNMLAFLASEFGVDPSRVFVQRTAENTANANQPQSIDYINGSSRFCWVGYIDTGDSVLAGEQGLTMRPTACARVLTSAPEVRTEQQIDPSPSTYVLNRWVEALFEVNDQLGGLITC